LFVSRDRKRAKALYFDGTGMCLLAKRKPPTADLAARISWPV
jgi:hypothetical protein